MPLSTRENFRRNASFQGHEWIPLDIHISPAYWHEAREALEDICLKYPALFPHFERGTQDFDKNLEDWKKGTRRKVDEWGCEWESNVYGMAGQVIGHPLADWAALTSWTPPDPPVFGDDEQKKLDEARARGDVVMCTAGHGFLFMRLFYLRGFENFIADVANQDGRLEELVNTVTAHYERKFRPYLEAGVDLLAGGDDLGTQTASVLGPRHFRRWLLPAYTRLFQPAREKGAHVFLHSDGYIMDIMDLIIESGVSIVNPQDLVNGIDNLAREVKGRVCIRVDIDRQKIVPFGSPQDVRDLIKEEVMKLGSPSGGLEMIVGIYPPTPPANVDALFSALDQYRTYWVGR